MRHGVVICCKDHLQIEHFFVALFSIFHYVEMIHYNCTEKVQNKLLQTKLLSCLNSPLSSSEGMELINFFGGHLQTSLLPHELHSGCTCSLLPDGQKFHGWKPVLLNVESLEQHKELGLLSLFSFICGVCICSIKSS